MRAVRASEESVDPELDRVACRGVERAGGAGDDVLARDALDVNVEDAPHSQRSKVRLRQLAPGAEEQSIAGRDRILGKDHSGLHVFQTDMGHGAISTRESSSICGVASYTA